MKTMEVLVLNSMLSIFNLRWTGLGLMYFHKLRYGEVEFFVTKEFEKIYEFLEVPFKPSSEEELVLAVSNSPYFHRHLFTSWNPTLIEFNKLIKRYNPINQPKAKLCNDYGALEVDKFFGTKILSKVHALTPIGMTKEALRSRFNGHLIQKWVNVGKGPIIKDLIQEFKEHIQNTLNVNFLDYLTGSTPKMVRRDFLFFYYEDVIPSYPLDDLPF